MHVNHGFLNHKGSIDPVENNIKERKGFKNKGVVQTNTLLIFLNFFEKLVVGSP